VTLRPTIIGSTPAPEPAQPLKPTVIGGGPDATLPEAPQATSLPMPQATAAPNAVTKLAGVERNGLQVASATLRGRHAEATPAAIERAVGLLADVVPEACTVRVIEQLGRSSQEGVARMVDRVLRIADDAVVRSASRYVQRLLELLGELADVLQPASGLRWRRKTLQQALSGMRPELDRLRESLEQSEAQLADRREQMAALQPQVQELLDQLDGVAIAVSELRPVFQDAQRLRALDDREADVAKAIALLQTHRLQMQRMEADLSQLAQRIRDAVLHALPAWLSAAISMPQGALNDTQRYSLMDPLRALIASLS
jgi:hypothetical protein